ncbi:uncharacterized protein LOC142243853 isoform X3 [Anomaloglossus baeobatrachus]|uniref:uncharacterized protein LOC142243853 isoform X3 n=1 Tax=Anomaloglossus baeobatrachus TaxID=238106 RepID=UPI003F4F8D49
MTGSHGAAFHCGTHADSLVPVYREITEDSALLTCLIQVQQHGFKVVVAQAALHQPLECSWGVAEPEWHTVELAEAHWRRECSLLLVRLCHGNLPIPTGAVLRSATVSWSRQLVLKQVLSKKQAMSSSGSPPSCSQTEVAETSQEVLPEVDKRGGEIHGAGGQSASTSRAHDRAPPRPSQGRR